jgi:hypothetical protein
MARRSAKPLTEVHGQAFLAAIRQIVATAQQEKSDTAFAAIVNTEIGEEIFTRDIVRSLRSFGLPGGTAKTDEPLRSYLHYLAPFLPYTEEELREIARGEMPDLSRLKLGKQRSKESFLKLSSDSALIESVGSTDVADLLINELKGLPPHRLIEVSYRIHELIGLSDKVKGNFTIKEEMCSPVGQLIIKELKDAVERGDFPDFHSAAAHFIKLCGFPPDSGDEEIVRGILDGRASAGPDLIGWIALALQAISGNSRYDYYYLLSKENPAHSGGESNLTGNGVCQGNGNGSGFLA